eukprot:CAMPEP_0204000762 /NCGR_PEP_ID=MMETSP0360-20130528/15614_1 /ASSEMBLY_ACC=CAM_ASM_000342 /TAXON_ID=268821 /ORGANISM="Scrippsiella Hangoei, Strain SHTV-5" /LENGTH=161 /DNA_ID=CAMNT_0050942105 /DNA_START=60 /DNA_END=541 /DNA_ORIENTATION=+
MPGTCLQVDDLDVILVDGRALAAVSPRPHFQLVFLAPHHDADARWHVRWHDAEQLLQPPVPQQLVESHDRVHIGLELCETLVQELGRVHKSRKPSPAWRRRQSIKRFRRIICREFLVETYQVRESAPRLPTHPTSVNDIKAILDVVTSLAGALQVTSVHPR